MRWLDAAGQSDTLARLRPASIDRLRAEIHQLIMAAAALDADAADATTVQTYFAAYPTRKPT